MRNQQFIFYYPMTHMDSRHLDINKPYAVGRTLLHAAASQTDNTHYILVLMYYGLEPDTLDDDFQTLLGRAVMLRYFVGAEIMLSDPRYDKAKVFETPHRIGYFLFEYHVFGNLRAVRLELVISQIQFCESVGATKAAMTRSNVLRFLSDDWPSIGEKVRGFNSWFLDWTLERMQAFRSRLSRLAELLLTTDIPLWCSEGLSRRGEVDKRFKVLDQKIEIALGNMRRTTEADNRGEIVKGKEIGILIF
ncbi:hypothetical protein EDB82DRAFT_476401 [Fusarium venenatum]|uniref:uncharacterized protein n=1 Tax=Fusarium venenatum TaxID=56646 RepID=UPI001DC988D6|nr:hypothetical protein EDB82DRAFT_476401 [Fusarium venenatum]